MYRLIADHIADLLASAYSAGANSARIIEA